VKIRQVGSQFGLKRFEQADRGISSGRLFGECKSQHDFIDAADHVGPIDWAGDPTLEFCVSLGGQGENPAAAQSGALLNVAADQPLPL
jgi:hypothetical protein